MVYGKKSILLAIGGMIVCLVLFIVAFTRQISIEDVSDTDEIVISGSETRDFISDSSWIGDDGTADIRINFNNDGTYTWTVDLEIFLDGSYELYIGEEEIESQLVDVGYTVEDVNTVKSSTALGTSYMLLRLKMADGNVADGAEEYYWVTYTDENSISIYSMTTGQKTTVEREDLYFAH